MINELIVIILLFASMMAAIGFSMLLHEAMHLLFIHRYGIKVKRIHAFHMRWGFGIEIEIRRADLRNAGKHQIKMILLAPAIIGMFFIALFWVTAVLWVGIWVPYFAIVGYFCLPSHEDIKILRESRKWHIKK